MPSIGMVQDIIHERRINYMKTQTGHRRDVMEQFEQARKERGWWPWSKKSKAAMNKLNNLMNKYPDIYRDFYHYGRMP